MTDLLKKVQKFQTIREQEVLEFKNYVEIVIPPTFPLARREIDSTFAKFLEFFNKEYLSKSKEISEKIAVALREVCFSNNRFISRLFSN